MRELGAQNAAIEAFVQLKAQGRDAANGLLAAQQAAEKLGAELALTEKPTRTQAGQLQKLHDEIRLGTGDVQANQKSMATARATLEQYGISTTGWHGSPSPKTKPRHKASRSRRACSPGPHRAARLPMAATKASPNCCLMIHPHPTLGESIGMAAEIAHGSCTDVPPVKKYASQLLLI